MVVSVNQASDLSDSAFASWQETIEQRLGLQLPERRRCFLKTCLAIRMREVGFDDYLSYHDFVLKGDAGRNEWNQLIDRITVQETRFFRDPDAFNLVERFLTQRLNSDMSPLSLWSVGCSSGEEAYSLAILIEELIAKHPFAESVRYGITGTDINKAGLCSAVEGSYPARRTEGLDKALIDKYFDDADEYKQVTKSLRDRACFVRLNLLALDSSPLNNLDVIYCQNVLIYFRKWRRKDIINELASRLAPGGLLVLGLGDMVDLDLPGLTRVKGEQTLAFIKGI